MQPLAIVLICKTEPFLNGQFYIIALTNRVSENFSLKTAVFSSATSCVTACQLGCTLSCMTVGVYIRVSTTSQKVDSQRAEIQHWLNTHAYQPENIRWYQDKETGRTTDRPAFRKLQTDIFNSTIKTVIVWKLDRLARKIKDGVNIIADWCEQGVRIVSTTQQIYLSGPAGHLFASMLFGIAEIELQHAKERQAAGIAVAKEKGIYTGRKKGTTKAKPEWAHELQAKGLTAPEIANVLGVAERTVFRYLTELD